MWVRPGRLPHSTCRCVCVWPGRGQTSVDMGGGGGKGRGRCHGTQGGNLLHGRQDPRAQLAVLLSVRIPQYDGHPAEHAGRVLLVKPGRPRAVQLLQGPYQLRARRERNHLRRVNAVSRAMGYACTAARE